ncbi:MAG: hypothetical protein LBR55_06810 [Bacteroidales bacterium]|nr:hypothetical protein [Bacteroidales bacterium]
MSPFSRFISHFCLLFISLFIGAVYAQTPSYSVQSVPIRGAVYSSLLSTKNNNVVIGSHKRRIYFFDEHGTIQQEFRTKLWVHATPAIVSDSLIAIGSYDGHIYFFNEQGVLKNKISPGGRIFTNLAQIDSTTVMFGTGKKKIVFYNLLTHALNFEKTNKLTHGSPVVLSNRFTCIGSNDKHLYIFNDHKELVTRYRTNDWIMHSKALELPNLSVVFGCYDKNIYNIDLQGNTLWKLETKGRIHASPRKIDDEKIVVGSFDKHIYILNCAGKLLRSIPTKKRIVSSAVITPDKKIVIGSYDKHIYILNENGDIEQKIPAGGKIFSTPTVLSNGTIVCATTNGKVLFIRPITKLYMDTEQHSTNNKYNIEK